MDDFISLSNRLLNRVPAVGIVLSRQFINDAWRTLQSEKEWSFRRRGNTIAPPTLYQTGTVTVVGDDLFGNPTQIVGVGTGWTTNMVGRQIRIGGLGFPYYTITAVIPPSTLYIDQPWVGPNQFGMTYQILQVYYPMPQDFGYLYTVVDVRNAMRLWTNLTESDLAVLDPQRTNYGQTMAMVYKDYTTQVLGQVGIAQPVNVLTGSKVPKTTGSYTFPGPLSYIIQMGVGAVGAAFFNWGRLGAGTGNTATTSADPIDLEFGVQVYFPASAVYAGNEYYVIQCTPLNAGGGATPRYEMWPSPTFNGYLYPYIYIAKESDLTLQQPQLPPFMANRGEVLLEMALQKCAEYPGADSDRPNVYYNLKQAMYHAGKVTDMLIGLERNDEEVGVTNIDYSNYPYYPAPWDTGSWQQSHAPSF